MWPGKYKQGERASCCIALLPLSNMDRDAHVSCKDGPTRRLKHPTTGKGKVAAKVVKLTAPFAPSMVPAVKTPGHANGSALGLNSFVPAVPYTKNLAVPKPQNGRNDSVVAHLDAQAAAAERNRQDAQPPWMTSSGYGSALTGHDLYSQMYSPMADLDMMQNQQNFVPWIYTLPSQTQEATGSGAFAAAFGADTSRGLGSENAESNKVTDVSKKLPRVPGAQVPVSRDNKKTSKGPSSTRIRKK